VSSKISTRGRVAYGTRAVQLWSSPLVKISIGAWSWFQTSTSWRSTVPTTSPSMGWRSFTGALRRCGLFIRVTLWAVRCGGQSLQPQVCRTGGTFVSRSKTQRTSGGAGGTRLETFWSTAVPNERGSPGKGKCIYSLSPCELVISFNTYILVLNVLIVVMGLTCRWGIFILFRMRSLFEGTCQAFFATCYSRPTVPTVSGSFHSTLPSPHRLNQPRPHLR
jgi:hypothetical protein